MKQQRLIVVSADALVFDDMAHLRTLPNYKKYLAGGAEIQKVRSIYPTITYPVHVSIATGTYPDRHSIVSNYEFIPGKTKLPWKWFCDDIKVPDIFAAAKRAGLKTASVFWPVTGNNKNIDYLVDEYWLQSKNDDRRDMFRRSGSSEEVMKVIDPYIDGYLERKHPSADNFIVNCTCDMIRAFKPHLMMLHPANIDDYRHNTGVFSDKVTRGVEETDEWIGKLAQAAIDAGVWDETNLVLISDHGQLDIKRVMNINVFFADKGYIMLDENGKLLDWKVWCQSGGMSDLVYLRNPGDKQTKKEVYDILLHMRDEGYYGIGEVFTKSEIHEKERLSGDFDFVLESDDYTSFGDSPVRPAVRKFDFSDYRYGGATHGYLPSKGPQPIFAAKGPAFKNGAMLETGRIVDEAPTFAKVLGANMPDTDGVALDELLDL